jgi:hypothetical protein
MNYAKAQAQLKDKYPSKGVIYNVPNSKKSNNKIKSNNLELDEWFVYLIDGEKIYYKDYQELNELEFNHAEVKFLGIGRPNQSVHKPNFPTKYATVELKLIMGCSDQKAILRSIEKSKDKNCCYCEVELTTRHISDPTHRTREHVVPKSRGGKIIMAACFECNQEKGNLMLHSYIQMLNYKLHDYKGELLSKLQTKIKNANKIAKQLSLL